MGNEAGFKIKQFQNCKQKIKLGKWLKKSSAHPTTPFYNLSSTKQIREAWQNEEF